MKTIFSLFRGEDDLGGIARSGSWVEEAFHLSKRSGRHIPLPETPAHTQTSISPRRLGGIWVLCLAFLLLATGRLLLLQGYRGESYRALALRNSQRIIPIPADRGVITDRLGVALTENVPKFSLAIVPQDLPRNAEDRQRIIDTLATLTGESNAEINTQIETYRSYRFESVVIKDDLPYETALSIYVALSDLPGISILRGSKRLYVRSFAGPPFSESASVETLGHVLGYLGKLDRDELDALYARGYRPSDDIGKTGLEQSYEEILRGIFGKRLIEVDAFGRIQHVLAEEAPYPGQHLTLALDIRLQEALERSMRAHLTAQKNRAVGIVSDVNTGEILAMASIPAFDNNDFSGGISQEAYTRYVTDPALPLFNRAIAGTYPSGSTIKPAIAAIGLAAGVITPATIVQSTGGIAIGQWFFPDWQAGGHGITNVTKAIAWSVNTFFYYLGGGYGDREGLGMTRLMEGLAQFGFSRALGIDLPGEKDGFLPSPEWKQEEIGEPWYIGDTYNVSIGQGDILVTPLQINAMAAAIANGGTLYRPRLVHAITDPVTKKESVQETETVFTLPASKEDLAVVRQGMRECVIYGSCRRLDSLPFLAAGKTGTAQWNSTKANHAWFTSFAPYDNPQVAVTILVEEGVEGSAISAPIAYDFYKEWWRIIHEPVVDSGG